MLVPAFCHQLVAGFSSLSLLCVTFIPLGHSPRENRIKKIHVLKAVFVCKELRGNFKKERIKYGVHRIWWV